MVGQHSVATALAILCCVIVCSFCVPVDVALNKAVEANVTCGYSSPERFLSHRYVYVNSTTRESRTETCVNRNNYPPTAMVDGRDDTWWQSASRMNTIAVLGSSAKFDAEIFIDLQQVCIQPTFIPNRSLHEQLTETTVQPRRERWFSPKSDTFGQFPN